MNVYWVKLRSWHIVDMDTRIPARKTLCGRDGNAQMVDVRPEGKTCEVCYRIGGPR